MCNKSGVFPTTVFRPRFGFLEVMGNDIQFSEGTNNHCLATPKKAQFVRDVMYAKAAMRTGYKRFSCISK
jgi:hypothetical protein